MKNLLMDDHEPLRVANALGHPMSQMIAFAGIIFNGIFDKFPGLAHRLYGSRLRLAAHLHGALHRLLGEPCAIRSARPLLAA